MRLKFSWGEGLMPLMLLGVSLTTQGCTTPTTAPSVERSIVDDICRRAWLAVEYDSERDSPETVEGVRANNRARAAFCK